MYYQKEFKSFFKAALKNDNHSEQVVALKFLGTKYLLKREYTRAAALYNTALVIVKANLFDNQYHFLEKRITQNIKEVERLYIIEIVKNKTSQSLTQDLAQPKTSNFVFIHKYYINSS